MSTQTLCISVTFLQGRYHGVEWPPSPARLYQAMVAGLFTCAYREHADRVEPALRWLEQQAAPEIRVCRHLDEEGYQLAVPNNDLDVVARDWRAGRWSDPARLRTMKAVRPRAPNGDGPHVQYVWQVDPSQAQSMLPALRTVARCLHTLGRGIDMAYADLAESPGLPIAYRPAIGGAPVAVPMPGTLVDLQDAHKRFTARISNRGVDTHTRPSMLRMQRYRRDGDSRRPSARFMLLKPASDAPRAVAWRDCMKVAGWMRHAAAEALLQKYGQAFIDEYILGHTAAGDKSQRVSYVPLPSIYGRYNDGLIRRVLIVEPIESAGEVTETLALKLMGRVLVGREQREECVLGPSDPEDWTFRQYLPDAGRRVWRSVTPVILHGHNVDRRGSISVAKTERLLLRAFEMAGVPETAIDGLAFQTAPLWPGTGHARAILTPDHLQSYPKVHVEVRFKEEVCGPMLAGIGRHYGIGVFASVNDLGRPGC
jgi:CRISPR-associated protein Csb2